MYNFSRIVRKFFKRVEKLWQRNRCYKRIHFYRDNDWAYTVRRTIEKVKQCNLKFSWLCTNGLSSTSFINRTFSKGKNDKRIYRLKLTLNQFLIKEIKRTYFWKMILRYQLSINILKPNQTFYINAYTHFSKGVDQTERKSLAPLLIQISVDKIPDIGKIST